MFIAKRKQTEFLIAMGAKPEQFSGGRFYTAKDIYRGKWQMSLYFRKEEKQTIKITVKDHKEN